ncbi:beta-ribofuranosylaminobenzene 5'-phosphate synthase family protein [Methylomonas methanica]|uniref:Beta-ribofuranosylaminobenzene 5'-phosphate synthase family n=1 Tax=Methylomonas methanica (strain DSM 25384 / MC09) TaxID=857087 RepID=F9ZV83_METMM|nr:beta-ribofuranosylaminobenzene 5'-phosphate synthase family protein [Methylomonas methanica]AEG00693.1 beta-ribofuranosylaminobenzene 5'-phosphate synthase family [Methylomonas methanica MC09]
MKPHYEKVTVLAPARLHMGFIDLSGALGRHFGSIGLALNDINTHLTVTSAPSLTATGPCAARALKAARQLCQLLDISDNIQLELSNAIPEHIGLGSGTQMSLAIGAGLNAFYNLGLSVRDIARLTYRGARSGIGIGVFEQGGLVVDGGRGPDTETPPLLSHMAVPEDWRFILAFDQRGQGLHGEQEVSAFKQLPPFPRSEAERLCYLLVMQALPAIAERNLPYFGEVITELQRTVGQHFAPVQGGIFTSPEVAAGMDWLQQQGAVALGQTSWGPTGFCAVETQEIADGLLTDLQSRFTSEHLCFKVVSARNAGAEVTRI